MTQRELIEAAVRQYIRDNPFTMEQIQEYKRYLKAQADDSLRMTTEEGGRFLGTIPIDLLVVVQRIDPELFGSSHDPATAKRMRKKSREFFKTYYSFAFVDKSYI